MSALWPDLPLATLAARFLVLLLGAALKGSLIFAMVYGATRLMRADLPLRRYPLWLGALSSFLLILILSPLSFPLLPWPQPVQAVPDGLYGTVSGVLLPRGGVAVPGIRSCCDPFAGGGDAIQVVPWGPSWAIPLLSLWLAGALACLLRVAVGSLRVHFLVVEARRGAALGPLPRYELAVGRLALAAGIRRPVRIVESPSCRVPYARGILRPLVMLPSAARAWRSQRLHAVLLHELRHIKCLDSLTQGIAWGICSLFWFVPFAWMARSFLCAEREKCCDAVVVGNGVSPQDYAACLVAAARCSLEPLPFAGLHSPSWSRRVLMDRIQNILQGPRGGKKRRLVFALAVFAVCVLPLLGSVGGKQALPVDRAYERFVGAWVNEGYPGDMFQPEVRVLRPDYVGVDRLWLGFEFVCGVWQIIPRKAWNDAWGNTYCQFSWVYTSGWKVGANWRRGVGLMRVDQARNLCEGNLRWGVVDSAFPERIDPEAGQYWYRYFVYHRREGWE